MGFMCASNGANRPESSEIKGLKLLFSRIGRKQGGINGLPLLAFQQDLRTGEPGPELTPWVIQKRYLPNRLVGGLKQPGNHQGAALSSQTDR